MLRGPLGPVGSMWCWAALMPGVWLAWYVGPSGKTSCGSI